MVQVEKPQQQIRAHHYRDGTARHLKKQNEARSSHSRSPLPKRSPSAAVALKLSLEGLADEIAKAEGMDRDEVRGEMFRTVGFPPDEPQRPL